jgi:hypothetical protein
MDANVRALESKDELSPKQQRTSPNGREQSRTDAAVRTPDERYLERLESENHFLREQISVKD